MDSIFTVQPHSMKMQFNTLTILSAIASSRLGTGTRNELQISYNSTQAGVGDGDGPPYFSPSIDQFID